MKNLLSKEMKLSASPLSYFFILFALLSMVPGYPILLTGFFICFGLFHTFQSGRENNDVLYTLLLPVKKSDTVKARFIFVVFIQMCGFISSMILTFVRMNFLSDLEPYVSNPLMNANQIYLAWILMVYAAFNLVFIQSYFKTAYKIGLPFLGFGIITIILIVLSEALHHIPGLEWLNATATMNNISMWLILAAAFAVYVLLTFAAMKISMKHFDKVDM